MASEHRNIAIVGMGCRFPGGAHSPEELWKLLQSGKCTMEDVPPSRFDIEAYWSESSGEPNKTSARKGHFLQEGTCFDESFFNLSPREARNMDPQHRILLETVVDALDSAGYKPQGDGGEIGWDPSMMGVFVGSATDSYQNNLASQPIDAFFCPATIRGFASGRISHFFGWQGPSLVFDTACASALTAVHAACQSLLLNECNAAVAGATNMLTSPEMYLGLSKGFFISNTDGCRAFDESADGYCRAEGVGVIILKRLEDALRDNDKIEGIIVASGVNQSGLSESLTAPHPPTQANLFSANCKRAGISPLAIRAVEAHGAGTQAGDYAEMEAIKMAYCDGRDASAEAQLFVSSLKPNIGHSESTAGMASLMKAVLMTKHRQMLMHTGIFTRQNPRMGDLNARGIVIPAANQLLEPVSGQKHVFIAVHNFGASGCNAGIIVQDPVQEFGSVHPTNDFRTYHIITLSAKPHTPFAEIISRLLKHLNTADEIPLASLSYTITARRTDYSSRIAFSVSSVDDLRRQLEAHPSPVTHSQTRKPPKVGFLIAGNGSQFRGMGEVLYLSSPVFRSYIDACNGAATKAGVEGVVGLLARPEASSNLVSDLDSAIGIFSVGYALGMMWKEWGIKPSLLLGHSLGEYIALALAGCVSLVDSIKLLVAKVNSVHSSPAFQDGSMLAVSLAAEQTRKLIDRSGYKNIDIACINGKAQTVVAGEKSELLQLQSFLQKLPDAPQIKFLPGSVAWHSFHLIQPAESLKEVARTIQFKPAEVPILLNVSGSLLQQGETPSSDYLSEQMVKPILFDACASHPLAQEVDIWIELSAKSVLLPLLRPLVPFHAKLLPTLGSSTTDPWLTITRAIAQLYEAQVPINWAEYHQPYTVDVIPLPSYPFARNEHWIPYTDRLSTIKAVSPPDGPISQNYISTPLGLLRVEDPWKKYTLHPGTSQSTLNLSSFVWLAFTCTRSKYIADLEILRPVEGFVYLEVAVQPTTDGEWSISFYGHDNKSIDGELIATCEAISFKFEEPRSFDPSSPSLSRSSAASYLGKDLLAKISLASGVTEPDGSGSSLDSLAISSSGQEALAEMTWAPDAEKAIAAKHQALTNLPFTPSELSALFRPASVLLFLDSSSRLHLSQNGLQRISRVALTDLVTLKDALSSHQMLRITVFLENVNSQSRVQQMTVFSKDNLPIIQFSGFGGTNHTTASSQPISSQSEPRSLSLRISNNIPTSAFESTVLTPETLVGSPQSSAKARDVYNGVTDGRSPEAPSPTSHPSVTRVLSEELGVPERNIIPEDLIEDVGVDSIMWHILKNRLYTKPQKRGNAKWPIWRKGRTVRELCDIVQSLDRDDGSQILGETAC